MDPILFSLQNRAGIHFVGVDPYFQAPNVAHDFNLAQDAQPTMISVSNAGAPAFLSTLVDPNLIEVLLSPMRAAEIVGEEVKKGDWTTETAMFIMIESTGETASYGDYNENGVAGVNANFPQRQSYHYQVITQWGERELAKAGVARIDWANRLNIASALTLNKFQNKSYFYGVAGLENYGLLNDPSLTAAITPTTKAATGTLWADATALEILDDVQLLFKTAQAKANGLLELDTPFTLAMSPASEVYLTKTTEFNVNASEILRKNFPGITIKVAPEYSTDSGNLVQLIVGNLEAQQTAICAFTEKMRAHPITVGLSSFKQKKSQGTFGTIIFRPFLITQMLGV